MRQASEAELTRIGKIFSWLIIVALIALALVLREKSSLVELMDRKLDLLIQLLPAFIIGIRWPRLHGGAVLTGLVCGVSVALVLAFGDFEFAVKGKIYGFHPGLIGLLPNCALAIGLSLALDRGPAQPPAGVVVR